MGVTHAEREICKGVFIVSSQSKSFKIGRNSETGRLTTVGTARSHKSTHQVEHMPKRGYGDTDQDKKSEK